MQLKQFYNIATKVTSRKSATTFGDLPDWLSESKAIYTILHISFFSVNILWWFRIAVELFILQKCMLSNNKSPRQDRIAMTVYQCVAILS